MKKILALLMIPAIALMICACGKSDSDNGKSTKNEVSVSDSLTIATPYAELRTPENYEGNVKCEVESKDPYTLTFYAKKDDTKLYSLIFNGEGDMLLGTILGKDAYTTVYATVYALDIQDETYDDNAEYQEGMYTILTNLRKDYEFEDNTVVEKPETFEIKTDVVTLHYPKKWEDKVDIKKDKETVTFSSDGTELFIFSFVDNDGYPLGEYQEHPIYLTTGSLSEVDPDSDNYKELSAMQDDVNVILEILESDPDFVSAHASE